MSASNIKRKYVSNHAETPEIMTYWMNDSSFNETRASLVYADYKDS